MEIARYPLFAAGVGFVLYGLRQLVHALKRYRVWLVANGTVVGYDKHPDGEVFAPRIEYTAADGFARVFVSQLFGSQHIPVGGSVRIRYSPTQPEQAEVASFAAWWLFPLVWLAFGIVFLLASILTPRHY